MTLRARLTATFLAVVLGPVLLGAVFVGVTVNAVNRERAIERLAHATAGVQTSIAATCQRLRSAAETTAMLWGDPRLARSAGQTAGQAVQPATGQVAASAETADPARYVVESELASAIIVATADDQEAFVAGVLPSAPWAACPGGSASGAARQVPEEYGGLAFAGLSAEIDIHDSTGLLVGTVTAVEPLNDRFVVGLSDVAGVSVSVVGGGPALSTERDTQVASIVEAARDVRDDTAGETRDGRYIRRIDPGAGNPLTVVLSVSRGDIYGLYGVLIAVVAAAGITAVGAAWALARSTTRPLTQLASAVECVAAGELATRVPVGALDEVGRLATTFNRMTRETEGYVHALTASRDQLRRQLGVLGDTLSSTHDLNRILRVILQTASVATGARAGVVLLADQATGVLIGQCSEGLIERSSLTDIADLRLRVGEGLLGVVAASGEPRRGKVGRDGSVLVPHEPQCLTYVAVPLIAPTAGPTTGLEPVGEAGGGMSARGVLALYDRHGFDEFDDTDLVTLRTFASQVAVALDNVRVHEEAQRLSLTDALTGLSNYRYLRESLRREIERASRFGHYLAVLVLDLDHFKEINDTYGHAAGDAVLAEFARRVRTEIREVDLAFRQGGEEFVVLLPETDAEGAEAVALRLGDAISKAPVAVVSHLTTRPLRISVTVSVGAAVYPVHGEGGLAVLEAADDALYAAKAAGRNTFRLAGRAGG